MALMLYSPLLFASKLGFSCNAYNRVDPTDRMYFNILLDTNSYRKEYKDIEVLVFHLIHQDMEYIYQLVDAFYVSPSKINPQYYIRAKSFSFYEHQLDFEIYPLANKMLGYSNLTLKKNGVSMEGTCERAEFYDDLSL